jgi:hypothetical protein
MHLERLVAGETKTFFYDYKKVDQGTFDLLDYGAEMKEIKLFNGFSQDRFHKCLHKIKFQELCAHTMCSHKQLNFLFICYLYASWSIIQSINNGVSVDRKFMEVVILMLIDIRRSHKDTHHIFSLTCGIKCFLCAGTT